MNDNKTSEEKLVERRNRLLRKVIKEKERKFGIKYDGSWKEYESYCLYCSSSISSYSQYKHYAGFYGKPVLTKAELFANYRMSFEIKTDMVMMQDDPPSRESYAKNVPVSSCKWTAKELKILRNYVLSWKDWRKKSDG